MASVRIIEQVKKTSRLRSKLHAEKNDLYRLIRKTEIPLRHAVIKLLYLHTSRDKNKWVNEIDTLLRAIAGQKINGTIPPFGVFFAPLFADHFHTSPDRTVDRARVKRARSRVYRMPEYANRQKTHRFTRLAARAMDQFYIGICKDLASDSYKKTTLGVRIERMLIWADEYPEDFYFMTTIGMEDSGLPMRVDAMQNMFSRHHCRLRVQTKHGRKWTSQHVTYVTVNDHPKVVHVPLITKGKELTPQDFESIKKFIALNKEVLLRHWRRETDSIDLLTSIKNITTDKYGYDLKNQWYHRLLPLPDREE